MADVNSNVSGEDLDPGDDLTDGSNGTSATHPDARRYRKITRDIAWRGEDPVTGQFYACLREILISVDCGPGFEDHAWDWTLRNKDVMDRKTGEKKTITVIDKGPKFAGYLKSLQNSGRIEPARPNAIRWRYVNTPEKERLTQQDQERGWAYGYNLDMWGAILSCLIEDGKIKPGLYYPPPVLGDDPWEVEGVSEEVPEGVQKEIQFEEAESVVARGELTKRSLEEEWAKEEHYKTAWTSAQDIFCITAIKQLAKDDELLSPSGIDNAFYIASLLNESGVRKGATSKGVRDRAALGVKSGLALWRDQLPREDYERVFTPIKPDLKHTKKREKSSKEPERIAEVTETPQPTTIATEGRRVVTLTQPNKDLEIVINGIKILLSPDEQREAEKQFWTEERRRQAYVEYIQNKLSE